MRKIKFPEDVKLKTGDTISLLFDGETGQYKRYTIKKQKEKG